MYKLDHNKKYLPKNILDLNKTFIYSKNNFEIDSIKNLENYFKKLKK